jgi:hypothetical protein
MVVERGQIVEAGTHEELNTREDSTYHRLVARQMLTPSSETNSSSDNLAAALPDA